MMKNSVFPESMREGKLFMHLINIIKKHPKIETDHQIELCNPIEWKIKTGENISFGITN